MACFGSKAFLLSLACVSTVRAIRVGEEDGANVVANMTNNPNLQGCESTMDTFGGSETPAMAVEGGMVIKTKVGMLKQCSGCVGMMKVFACDAGAGPKPICSMCVAWDALARSIKDQSIKGSVQEAAKEAGGDVGCNIEGAGGGGGGYAENACCFMSSSTRTSQEFQECEKRGKYTEREWRRAREKFVAEMDTSDPTKCPPETGQGCNAFNALGNMFQGNGGDGCHSELNAKCDESDKMCKCVPGSCFNGRACVSPEELAEKHIGRIPL